MIKLLKCPRCGNIPKISAWKHPEGGWIGVVNCQCSESFQTVDSEKYIGEYSTIKMAKNAMRIFWNAAVNGGLIGKIKGCYLDKAIDSYMKDKTSD